jgi:hypothetical protein
MVRMGGLFGDAWVACELGGPVSQRRSTALERAQRWCAEVVTAMAAAPADDY